MKQLLFLAFFALFVNISYAQTPDSLSTTIAFEKDYSLQQESNEHYRLTHGEKLYLNGVAISMLGGGLTMVSMVKDSNVGVTYGGVTIATGTLIAILGQHEMIIEERSRNKDAISVSPSSYGFGFAINF
ncbi:hypothetical protein [Draconibacterium orientale]|uniref:hypothetical protein n=1 Tax=Draconibacterium orientale TaxID=1168034 RepID=UPI0029BFEBBD|nr:hypothetical protein [Draconibacterium orientale]